MKPNCLTRALNQWNEDKSMRLWYNSNHVVAIESYYELHDINNNGNVLNYLPLESFGTFHFIVSFQLSKKYLKLLGEYFNEQSENVKII